MISLRMISWRRRLHEIIEIENEISNSHNFVKKSYLEES